MKESIQLQSCSRIAQKQRSSKGISIVDNRPSLNGQMNLKNIIQMSRVATNVFCPSWGNAAALGSYIHGLFETEFLSGGIAPALAPVAGPAVPNSFVEEPNPNGGISDFAQIFPGFGMCYAELKPAVPAAIAAGAAAIAGLNTIAGIALPPIPLDNIDPNAQPQPAAGAPIYGPVPPNPAPAPGVIPQIHFGGTGIPGVYRYDAW